MINLQELIVNGIILFALIIGSITDFKKREVPDYLNFSLISIGIFIGLLNTVINHTWWSIVNSIAGLIAGYLIAALMYYSGQWGGGDAKMLMGIGAIIGINLFGPQSLIKHLTMPDILTLTITILLVGSIYGLVYLLTLMIIHWKKIFKELKKELTKKQKIIIQIITIILSASTIIWGLVDTNKEFKLIKLVFGISIFVGVYFSIIFKTAENIIMIKRISTKKLVEGDWITKNIYVKKELIYKMKKTGVEEEDIKKIRNKKIKFVLVKDGIPFIPGFLIGFIVYIILGNWWIKFIKLFFM